MKKLSTLVSFWAFVALVALIALQMIPYIGVVLMVFAAPWIAGLLIHVVLGSLIVEALCGRISKMLLVLPLLVYGGYYAFYFYQGAAITTREAELQGRNPGLLMTFDPTTHALVMKDALAIVKGYHIPVVYSANTNVQEGYRSHRLMQNEECQTVPKDTQSRVHISGVSYDRALKRAFIKHQKSLCHLTYPERPEKPLITVAVTDPEIWKHRMAITEERYTVEFEGKTLGTFTRAFIYRISPIPFFAVGCGLVSSKPAWECGATVKKSLLRLETIPPGVDQERFTHPVSIMLGIEKYTTDELMNYVSPPSNLIALRHVQGEAHRVQNDVLAQLDKMFVDKKMKMPHNMGYSLTKSPDQLVDKAESMVTLFETLHGPTAHDYDSSDEKKRVLAKAMTALPQATFEKYVSRLFPFIQAEKAYDQYPRLYIRVADMGAEALPFYKEEFMTARIRTWLKFIPVLAICRIGTVDTELLNHLKQEFKSIDVTKANNDRLHQAIFVTLLRLGERDFAATHYQQKKLRYVEWYQSFLDKAAQGSLGRDQCEINRW